MNLGKRLIELRKEKHLSQEEAAEKLNVTRQTISKWETDASTPDFDKIVPICELYGITSEELLTGNKPEERALSTSDNDEQKKSKRTFGLVIGILSYFVALAWIMVTVAALNMNPVICAAIFLLIVGIGTCVIIYSRIVYKDKKEEEKEEHKLSKPLETVLSLSFLTIYLIVSFITMAWHITWLIWIVYGLVEEIIILIISMKGDKNE